MTFDPAHVQPRRRSRDTSRAALAAIQPRLGQLARRALAAIRAAGLQGLTADECGQELGIHLLTMRPTITRLGNDGLILDSGLRRTNRVSGKQAIVWRVPL